jgi:hypothetical protein
LTAVLPKSRDVALNVNCELTDVPVPLRAIDSVGFVAELLETVKVPVAEVVDVGLNWTCNVRD